MSSVSTKSNPYNEFVKSIRDRRDRTSDRHCQHNERISCHSALLFRDKSRLLLLLFWTSSIFVGEDRTSRGSEPAIYLSWFKVWKQLIKLNCYLILPLLLVSYLTIFKANQPVVESLLEISKFLYLVVNLFQYNAHLQQ